MATKVLMPQLGESVIEGTITRWLKAVGEQVEEHEPLVEVNTDKVDTEVPSPASGVLLEILAPEGTVAQAGAALAVIGVAETAHAETAHADTAASGESAAAAPPANGGQPIEANTVEAAPVATQAAPAPAAPAAPTPSADRSRDLGFISPVVAKIAGEHRIDLFQVTGTGQGGRITKRDVLAYIESGARPAPAAPVTAAAPSAPPPPSAPSIVAGDGEIQPLTAVRRSIAEHMVLSRRTSPHVSTIMEADLSRVVAHRQANKDRFAQDGVSLTYTAYFTAAAAAALKAFPMVNSSWTDDGVLLHRRVNIGMATSLGEAGLIVPVIRDADGLSLLGIARAVNDLANRARARKLKPDEVQGGTFTITNHGVSRSLFATPIINQPQCAILGVGMLQKRVVVLSDEFGSDSIAIRPMVYLGLTFDHRILDGAGADHFLAKVVDELQNWPV